MAERRTYIIELGKYDLVRNIIDDSMQGVLLNVPQRHNGFGIYHLGKTECSLFFDGENGQFIVTIPHSCTGEGDCVGFCKFGLQSPSLKSV